MYLIKTRGGLTYAFGILNHFQNAAEKFQKRTNVYETIWEELARAMSYANNITLSFYRQICYMWNMYKCA